MRHPFLVVTVIFILNACKNPSSSYILAFGSCNKQDANQSYWNVIQQQQPDVFIWGGDNIYADTSNLDTLKAMYSKQKQNPFYQDFLTSINHHVYATWDDHDYGLNDGGKEWAIKDQSQALFLDFLDVTDENRRAQRGIYHATEIKQGNHSIKIYVLDTRYFRDSLKLSTSKNKRYEPWDVPNGSILGSTQWKWLEQEIATSEADFNVIVSSIQFLSAEHGFETWGNFPHELERLKAILVKHQLKNTVLLSGDRHISEFSSVEVEGLDYDLYDFTSSGLTHSYSGFNGEPNRNRVGEVIHQTSFGLLNFDFDANEVLLEMRSTENAEVLQSETLKF